MTDVQAFAEWWLAHKPFRPQFHSVNAPAHGVAGVVLYRDGPFQVQLFTFQPNVLITPHRHGHIDTIVHYVTGEVFFFINGKETLPRADFATDETGLALLNFREGGCMIRVRPSDWHGATIGAAGGAFMSIQHWLDGKPQLTELDWEGPALDARHAQQLGLSYFRSPRGVY
jgi:hypothetical protein